MSTDQSVIHDIGYQRYAGVRLGRGYATGALYAYGLRTAFGLGRGAKAKIFPWFVVAFVSLPAAVFTAVRAQTGQQVTTYPGYVFAMVYLLVLFCAVVAPELVSRDLRSGVLPLYFSRPLARSDYALAKFGALATALWLLLAVPMTLMFIGAAFTVGGIRAVWNEFQDFAPALAYPAIFAVLFAAISLLVASLASRRAVAAAVIVAVFLVTTPIVGVLSLAGGDAAQLAFLASPITMVQGVGVWLFGITEFEIGPYGPTYGLTTLFLSGLCVLLLLFRYQRVAR